MFAKQKEPLTSSERLKQKRNLTIYKTLESSNNICMDASKNIRNAINYESYLNVVDGFYESRKSDISNNRNCFNVQLLDDTDEFKIRTFDDVYNSFIDFKNSSVNKENTGLGEFTLWNPNTFTFVKPASGIGTGTDQGFVVEADDISGVPVTNFLKKRSIEKASDIVYPYMKKGICSNLIIPKLTYFDPSGNTGKTARDLKKFFPMSKLSFYPTMCGNK
tara:strand:- start:77 stop:733 length:657 start_codon:yes stop_codon:yes gene_type:complete